MTGSTDSGFPFPSPSEHTTILGRNGSGKTQGGLWLWSHSDFDERPHIFVNIKEEEMFERCGAKTVSLHDDPPHLPGVYQIRPKPVIDDDALESYLWKIHSGTRKALFFDEGATVARFPSVDAILMQGRSKQISITMVSQRPVMISRWAFSEASHIIAYHLHDRRDQKTTREFFNNYKEAPLPDYHAQWYEVKKNKNHILHPVPDTDSIIARFQERLAEMQPKKSRFF